MGTGTGSISRDVAKGVNGGINALNVSMDLGFVYGETSMSDSLKATNKSAVNGVVDYDSGWYRQSFKCTSADTKEAVGLWHWIVRGSDDYITASTEQFICRFNALA